MPLVEVAGVSKRFTVRSQVIDALTDVSFSVEPGEFVAIVGPSGCGKTTLLRIIAGLLDADTGRVTVDGVVVAEPSWDRGILFQHLALFPWLTVRGNVDFPLVMAKLPRAERRWRVDRYLREFGLMDFAELFPGELSGGMQQRVALARTLVREPRLLLLDEPFGALDAHTRRRMQDFAQEHMSARVATTVLVTHDVEEAAYLADRVIVFSAQPGSVLAHVDVPLERPRPSQARYGTEIVEVARMLDDFSRQWGEDDATRP